MSINFSQYIQKTYQGSLYATPFKASADPSAGALVVPVTINWIKYGAALTRQLGVNINLAQSVAQGVIPQICSVIIDNLLCSSPVYVQFPDTNWVVRCPANARICSPAVTNGLNSYVFTDDIQNGNNTTIFFSNVPANYFKEQGDPGSLTSRLVTGPDGTFNNLADVHGELTAYGHIDIQYGSTGLIFAAQNLNNSISSCVLKTVKLYTSYCCSAVTGMTFQIAIQSAPAGTQTFNATYVNVTSYAPAGRGALYQVPALELEDQYIQIPSNVDVYATFPANKPMRCRFTWFLSYTYV